MVQGLKYLREMGVVHCDMKPENILFTDESLQNLKIIDFGASCMSFESGFFYVQSRYYRAPEIILLEKNYVVALVVCPFNVRTSDTKVSSEPIVFNFQDRSVFCVDPHYSAMIY